VGLTGLSTVSVAAGVTLACVLLLARFWHRGGRARFVVRALGILLCQALLVATVGLEVNRVGDFYPSWQALVGDVGAAPTRAGAPGSLLPAVWRWPAAAWHLAAPPRLIVPAGRGAHPVLVLLLPPGVPVPARWPRTSAVGLVLSPDGPASLAALRLGLPAFLAGRAAVAPHGWAIVGLGGAAPVASALASADPRQYTALAVVATAPPQVPILLRGLRGRPGPQDTVLAATSGRPPGHLGAGWLRAATPGAAVQAALSWAAGQLPAPLAPPLLLPPAPAIPSSLVLGRGGHR
jgi:hypothetical protein